MFSLRIATVEVKSGASLRVDPVEGKSVHISQATLGKSDTNENVSVQLYMKAGDHKIGIGTLPNGKIPQLSMQILLDKGFELSHSWKNGSVHFSGYVIGPTEPYPFNCLNIPCYRLSNPYKLV
ncbi:unnamed protein product [Arabis nemorensis]|uniref:Nucleoplasmin-like domain-containing protein n=1 Tax=Arabis nemorensis TaxID=586526 RepID=A0A565B2Y1_9BRAS|nr:unnamed protein product [Arabis nemorensis]